MDSATRALELQRQAVMQQQVAASFFKDLEQWEQDIELKDKQLQQTSKLQVIELINGIAYFGFAD